VTIGGLPPRAREVLGLPWNAARERRYRRFALVVRALDGVYARFPAKCRVHAIPRRAFRREGWSL
jgi:uncharacterized protein (DUF2236 family)